MFTRVQAGFLGVVCSLALPAAAQQKEPGVLWEHTVEMEMPGFKMPATTTKSCAPKGQLTEPPGAGREKCKVTNLKHDGNRMTWDVVCEGSEGMGGHGDITSTADGYAGFMTMRGPQGEMRMNMRGKKLGGECDAGEPKRKVAAMQKKAEEMQAAGTAQYCDASIASYSAEPFREPDGMCRARKAELCGRLGTRQAFLRLSQAGMEPQRAELQAVCGKDPLSSREALCAESLRESALSGSPGQQEAFEFLGHHCPAQTQAIARERCAGRSYTDVEADYRGFCTRYAKELLVTKKAAPGAKPASAEDAAKQKAKDEAVEKGKKALKGLFGL
jgi:hypothetical protein